MTGEKTLMRITRRLGDHAIPILEYLPDGGKSLRFRFEDGDRLALGLLGNLRRQLEAERIARRHVRAY